MVNGCFRVQRIFVFIVLFTYSSRCGASTTAASSDASETQNAGILPFYLSEVDCEIEIFVSLKDVETCRAGGCGIPLSPREIESMLWNILEEEPVRGRNSLNGNNGKSDQQVVYLNFPDFPTFHVHVYHQEDNGALTLKAVETYDSILFTESDKQMIKTRLEEFYEGFRVLFTFDIPAGDFSTIVFEAPQTEQPIMFIENSGSLAITFGRAQSIDFRNRNFNDHAWIQRHLWKFLNDRFGVGVFVAASGIPIETTIEDAIREASRNQAIHTGAHELAHNLGLRHHNNLGIPNMDGLSLDSITMEPSDFNPGGEIFWGVVVGDNRKSTWLHVMTSMFGAPFRARASSNLFFSQRSAVKLLLGTKSDGLVYSEEKAKQNGESGRMMLPQLTVPDMIVEGIFAGKKLVASAVVIEGSIGEAEDESGEVDRYRFYLQEGQYLNVEVISFSSRPNPLDAVITGVSIRGEGAEGDPGVSLYTSLQELDGFDPLILDFRIPSTGSYTIEVFAQKTACILSTCINLASSGLGVFNTGMYDLLIYSVDRPLGPD